MDPRIRVVGVDPDGSIFYDYFHSRKIVKPSTYLLEGLGDEFLIGCVDFELMDDMVKVSDSEAFAMTRRLVLTEGLLVGGSSGAAACAVLRLAERLDRPARIATIFPDSAGRYLSTIFNDDWLHKKGLIGR